MGRITVTGDSLKNLWGAQGGSMEPQRTDLWQVDFSQALEGMRSHLYHLVEKGIGGADTQALVTLCGEVDILPQYVQSVTFPDYNVKYEDVVSYNVRSKLPIVDQGFDTVKMRFVLDAAAEGSRVLSFLELWQAFVRSASGKRSPSGVPPVPLYISAEAQDVPGTPFEFDVYVNLLSGSTTDFSTLSRSGNADFGAVGMDVVTKINLVRCWLASYRLPELSYEGSKVATIDAAFVVTDLVRVPVN